jgi:hypothetical protein
MHPLLAEILRIRRGEIVRADVLGRWQAGVREVQAQLDEVESLRARIAELEAKLPKGKREAA